ncbi:MAG: ABC transporter permease [Dictyoglomus thermophilum]
MKKFTNLLKKEIRELVTWQLIISLAFTLILFNFLGNITKSEIKKAVQLRDIYVLDLDRSNFSKDLLNNLSFGGFRVNLINKDLQKEDKDTAIDYAKKRGLNFLLIIPNGFGGKVSNFESAEVEFYSFIKSFSMGSTVGSTVVKDIIDAINNHVSNNFLKAKFPNLDPENIKKPIKSREFVIIKDKIAEASSAQVMNFVYSQSIFIPIVLMIVIMYASQMVLSAIALEKQDKTLETLLTVPVSRKYIVVAKMAGAGIVGLISAGVYMLGYRSFFSGITGGVDINNLSNEIITKLGLSFNSYGYFLLGLSLFLAVLNALALSTILGVLAEDLRSAQSLSFPIIILIMIPYFLSLFTDINSLSLPVKLLVYAIPFSHPFIASSSILLGNYSIVYYGVIYMLAVFIILILVAAKIFSTDKVITMKLSFGKKAKGSVSL